MNSNIEVIFQCNFARHACQGTTQPDTSWSRSVSTSTSTSTSKQQATASSHISAAGCWLSGSYVVVILTTHHHPQHDGLSDSTHMCLNLGAIHSSLAHPTICGCQRGSLGCAPCRRCHGTNAHVVLARNPVLLLAASTNLASSRLFLVRHWIMHHALTPYFTTTPSLSAPFGPPCTSQVCLFAALAALVLVYRPHQLTPARLYMAPCFFLSWFTFFTSRPLVRKRPNIEDKHSLRSLYCGLPVTHFLDHLLEPFVSDHGLSLLVFGVIGNPVC